MSCTPACSTCEQLREAALELIGEGGVAGLSLDALADRVGLARSTVEEHYPTAANCLYETYDEVSARVALDMAGAFAQGTSWETGFGLARQRLLTRLVAHPAEARLCFVEVVRGDRQLRLREDTTRQWIVDFLSREYEQRRATEDLPELQIELLIAAGFHAISNAVSAGGADGAAALRQQLADLAQAMGPASR